MSGVQSTEGSRGGCCSMECSYQLFQELCVLLCVERASGFCLQQKKLSKVQREVSCSR